MSTIRRKKSVYEFEKRAMDIAISSIAIILTSPILLIIAIAVKLESHGPVFADMPKRVGRNGKLFRMYKFRSMIKNAHQKLRTDPEFAQAFEQYKANSYKLLNDPRVTKVGKILRKTSLDELPQIINIFRGEMSLVGPRPYFADELETQTLKYPKTKDLIASMLSVKPGLTGPWQIGGRSQLKFSQRLKIDSDYAKKRSILYDLKIIIKSPIAIIFGRGAY